MRFGRFGVEIFSDGLFRQDGGLMFAVPKVLWQRVAMPDERNRVAVPMNCLLVRDDRHVVLFETGVGDKLDAKQTDIFGLERPRGLLVELAKRGVRREDVTLVLNTHLHFDHAGGNTRRDPDGRVVPTFRRARYAVQRLEWEDATHPHERSRASYFPDDFKPLERVVELLDGDTELLPGLRVVRVQGHTRGTQYLLLEQDGRTLFFSADFLMTRHHLALPWISALDLYPMDTLETKRALLSRAAEEQWLVAFSHDVPRFGHVRLHEGKYVYEEVER